MSKQEQIIFSDNRIKITSSQIECDKQSYPIKDIEDVGSDLRILKFNMWLVCFFLSFVPLYWYKVVPLVIFSVTAILISAFFIFRSMKSYALLYITIGGKKVNILTAPMNKREYIYKISEELAKTVIEVKNLAAKKDEIESSVPSYINPSLTLLLRMVNEKDREALKQIAKEARVDKEAG